MTYLKGRHECDFTLSRKRRPAEAIQVCWGRPTRNTKRELAGLTEAERTLGVKELLVLTYDLLCTVGVAGAGNSPLDRPSMAPIDGGRSGRLVRRRSHAGGWCCAGNRGSQAARRGR